MKTFKFCLSGSRSRRNAPVEEDGGSMVAIDDRRGGTVRPPWKPCRAREEAIKLNSSRRLLGTHRCWHSWLFKGLLALFTAWLLIIDVQLHCTGTVGGDHCPITAGSTLQFHSHRQLAPVCWQATPTERCREVQAPAQAVPEWLAEAQPCSPSVLQVQPEWVPAGAENGGGGTGHHGTVVLSTAPAGALRATAAGHYAPAD